MKKYQVFKYNGTNEHFCEEFDDRLSACEFAHKGHHPDWSSDQGLIVVAFKNENQKGVKVFNSQTDSIDAVRNQLKNTVTE